MAAKRIPMASGQQTANGNTDKFPVSIVNMGVFLLNVTVVTAGSFNVFLQGSDDDGTTWYDLPVDVMIKTDTTAGGDTPETNVRNINGATIISAAGQYVAIVKHLASKHIRGAWLIVTGPVTFTLVGDLK